MTGSPEGPRPTLTGVGQAGSVECGALIRVEVSVRAGRISHAHFKAYGCPATLACAQGLTDHVRGLDLLSTAAFSEQDLLRRVPEAQGRGDSAALALDALHSALSEVIASGEDLRLADETLRAKSVLVGMSGGVDSGVAALLLQEQGWRVVGVTLRLWDEPGTGGERSCCSPETVARARRVAHSMGIPHLTLDLTEVFREEVVRYFVDSYRVGVTPNPCAKCNARVRFGAMLGLADSLGCTEVATGHYARMMGAPPRLARGVDSSKDQSYVLAEVDPRILARVNFPLGALTKREVRALAAERGFEGHAAPESQEICFIVDDDHRRFLYEQLGELPGDVVDSQGKQLGRHTGLYNYTIGQRKGLGLAYPEPRFVTHLEATSRRVIVGTRRELATHTLTMESLTWHAPLPPRAVTVQVRSSGQALPVLTIDEETGPSIPSSRSSAGGQGASQSAPPARIRLAFDPPAVAVAPGQTAAIYDGESVVVAGTITHTTT